MLGSTPRGPPEERGSTPSEWSPMDSAPSPEGHPAGAGSLRAAADRDRAREGFAAEDATDRDDEGQEAFGGSERGGATWQRMDDFRAQGHFLHGARPAVAEATDGEKPGIIST